MKWNLGWVMRKNKPMENSKKRKFASPVFWWEENWRSKLWGVSNLKIFYTIDIKEMAAIFQFFHNSWHWYSISVNTHKTRDPNFGEVDNLKFFCMIDIKEMAAIYQFFHDDRHWYSISIDTQKTRDPNFGGSVNLNFSIQHIFTK